MHGACMSKFQAKKADTTLSSHYLHACAMAQTCGRASRRGVPPGKPMATPDAEPVATLEGDPPSAWYPGCAADDAGGYISARRPSCIVRAFALRTRMDVKPCSFWVRTITVAIHKCSLLPPPC
jgi:hypothetical protein